MYALRCKCGKEVVYISGFQFQDCQGCEECQTTYAGRPENHRDLIPHDWRDSYDEATGNVTGRRCRRCLEYERFDDDG